MNVFEHSFLKVRALIRNLLTYLLTRWLNGHVQFTSIATNCCTVNCSAYNFIYAKYSEESVIAVVMLTDASWCLWCTQ